MFRKMIVAAALVLTTGAALASDVSYDQRQLREGTATLVEGGLRPAAAQKVTAAEKAPSTPDHHMMNCSCSR